MYVSSKRRIDGFYLFMVAITLMSFGIGMLVGAWLL